MELDYSPMLHLDAEDVAEIGIGSAYEELLPELGRYVQDPVQIEEVIDQNLPSYAIRVGNQEHVVFEPDDSSDAFESWRVATALFFKIVEPISKPDSVSTERCPVERRLHGTRFHSISDMSGCASLQ